MSAILTSRYQENDKVSLDAVVKGVMFSEGKVTYKLALCYDDGEHSDTEVLVPSILIKDTDVPHLKKDKINQE